MEEKIFKILSIDGGGIKGLYSAEILRHLEEEYPNHLSDYFDMICGTSTGGIIALALSRKITMKNIVKFYKEDGPKIFPYHSILTRGIAATKQLLIKSKYPSKNLRTALEKVFADDKLKDAHNYLCIPSFNVSTGKNRVFKKNHHNLRGDDDELSMVEVALATSAAPTYFPMHKLESAHYIDGGIWANNPSFVGLTEALKHFVPDGFTHIKILSISSLNHTNGVHLKKRWFSTKGYLRHSFKNWGGKLFQVTLDAQAEFVDFTLPIITNNLACKTDIFTIPAHEISPENVNCIDLDMAGMNSLEILEIYGRQQGLKHRTLPAVADFFNSTKLT
jgi:uncharacterized protein